MYRADVCIVVMNLRLVVENFMKVRLMFNIWKLCSDVTSMESSFV